MPLIITVGFPGSGKSTVLKQSTLGLSQSSSSIFPQWDNAVVLSPDDFRLIITGQEYYKPLEEIVWFVVKNSARHHLFRGVPVLIDATHLTIGTRAQWVTIAREHQVDCDCLWIDTPFETCLKRNNNRQRVVPGEVMTGMRDQFTPPVMEEGFHKIVKWSEVVKGNSQLRVASS